MMKFFGVFLLLPILSFSQPSQQPGAGQIKLKLKKLNFLGSVLYMAAHPDDENTRIITYLANGKLATTAYLSLTRGDGGQNLIGPEIRDLLGVIRTQELLAARRIDGGQQFFTRAIDFGFSKNSEEAFRIWGKEQVLEDVLKVFRQYQPDVVITRFPPDARAGHGHHTASAMLANEGFDLAANKDIFPRQVAELGTWQPKRVYTNTGRWWNKEINESTPGIITIDVGGYNSLLGRSYPEIAAQSGSQHRSQGWGQPGNRGYLPEFLEHMKGEKASADIFEGVNTTWSRIKGSAAVQALVDRAIREFDEEKPSSSLPVLLQLKKEISKLEDSVWKTRKLQETQELIQDCLGLFIEATSSVYMASPGQKISMSLEIINRSAASITLNKISSESLGWDTTFVSQLKDNSKLQITTRPVLKEETTYSDPYWLRDPHKVGLFEVEDKDMIGMPQNNPAADLVFNVLIQGEEFLIRKPLIFKWTDNVKGELWRPFEIVPPVVVNLFDKVMVFNNDQPKEIRVQVKSTGGQAMKGNLLPILPAGWKAEPVSLPFEFSKPGEELNRVFKIFPSANESKGDVRFAAEVDGKRYDQSIQYIEYDHIPVQTLLPDARASVVRLDLKKEGDLIGYIRGAGDEIPAALRNMGFEVWEMKNEEITLENLRKTDAVVLGIRAINTNTRIKFFMADLLDYVKEGGTVVMQYNTNSDMEVEIFAPFPLKLGRDRVADEAAEVRFLKPEHPVLNVPNKITAKDFEGWVQERGLYFPSQWDPKFEAVLSMNDPGETAKDGSLLVANHGTGYFVYTGLSFFRELPEGVPGAYKLFANLVSIGKTPKPVAGKNKSKKQSRN